MIRLEGCPGQARWRAGICDGWAEVGFTAGIWPPRLSWPERIWLGPLFVRPEGIEVRLELGEQRHVAARLWPFKSLTYHGPKLVHSTCRREP